MDNTKKNSSTTGESTVFLPLPLFRGEFRPPRVCRDKYNGFLPTIGGTFKSKVLEESLANKFFTWWQFLHVSEATSRNGYGGSITKGMAARGAKFNYVRKTGWSSRHKRNGGGRPCRALCRDKHHRYLSFLPFFFFLFLYLLSRCYLDLRLN